MATKLDGFCTAKEAAELLGVSHATVTRYAKNGSLASVKMGPMLLIPRNAIRRFKRPPRGNPNLIANPPKRRQVKKKGRRRA